MIGIERSGKMSKNINFHLAIGGALLGVVGVIGTYYQILGYKITWIALLVLGFALLLALLFFYKKESDGLRKKTEEQEAYIKRFEELVATFGERWHLKDGQLLIGNTVNVALRTKTVQEILDAFRKTLPEENYRAILKDSGRRVGESFSEDLKKELILRGYEKIAKPGRDTKLLMEKLSLWSEYDSSTGMGIFEVHQLGFTVNGLQGDILLKNSFLAYDRQPELPACVFIEGYIEGVIGKLLGVSVVANEIECSSVTGSEYCKFEIAQK
jgi:predicted hydrocarbon binding protein